MSRISVLALAILCGCAAFAATELECDACQAVVYLLEKDPRANVTEDKIEQLFLDYCKNLSSIPEQLACKLAVTKVASVVEAAIAAGVAPRQVCETVHLCNATTVAAGDEMYCHDTYTDESSCNANMSCIWCLCSALPSSCFSIAQSHKLPHPTYNCSTRADKVSRVETPAAPARAPARAVVVPTPAPKAGDDMFCHDTYTDEKSCNANMSCVWCLCAALPSSCFSIAQSHELPKPTYNCSTRAVEAKRAPEVEEEVTVVKKAVKTVNAVKESLKMVKSVETLDRVANRPAANQAEAAARPPFRKLRRGAH